MAENLTSNLASLFGTPPPRTRLLGFVPAEGLMALQAALAAVAGPAVTVHRDPDGGAAALLQAEPAAPLLGRGRAELLAGLHSVQRRLEIACQAGAMLPVDPGAACCAATALPGLLAPAWGALPGLLARHGRQQQWDIVLRWTPESVLAGQRADIAQAAAAAAAGGERAGLAEAVAAALRAERARREAALLAALLPVVLAAAPRGAAAAETELALTVLLDAGGEAAVEAALEALDAEGADIDLRGPLPPLSFSPIRVAETDAAAVAVAWQTLDLPARIDAAELHRHWRQRAFALHPDRHAAAEAPSFATALSEATAAYHLLRDLARHGGGGGDAAQAWSLVELSRHAGPRLLLPAVAQPEAEPETDAVTRREAALALP